eukprot:4716227-Amphidinium_carterae.1
MASLVSVLLAEENSTRHVAEREYPHANKNKRAASISVVFGDWLGKMWLVHYRTTINMRCNLKIQSRLQL